MQRFDRYDIIMELIELYHDIKDDIVQQLSYYKASVYKSETAKIINTKIAQLKMLVVLMNESDAIDLFNDFEETKTNGNVKIQQGECLLTLRVMNLLIELDKTFANLRSTLQNNDRKTNESSDFTTQIQRNRRKFMSLCKHGTRQWSFFRTL